MNRRYGRPSRHYDDGMSFGKWIGTYILLLIPGINIIASLVWLFGGGKNTTRTNFVRASLFITIILSVIGVILYFTAADTISDYISKYIPLS